MFRDIIEEIAGEIKEAIGHQSALQISLEYNRKDEANLYHLEGRPNE